MVLPEITAITVIVITLVLHLIGGTLKTVKIENALLAALSI